MVAALAVAAALGILGLVGLLDAAYFVLVTHRVIRPDAAWLPRACRMDEETCAAIVDTPYARVFGLSNAAYGVVWYLVVLAAAGTLASTGALPACALLLVASAAVVLFSVYLVWALVQRLGTSCPLCFLAHGINLAVVVLLAAGCALG